MGVVISGRRIKTTTKQSSGLLGAVAHGDIVTYLSCKGIDNLFQSLRCFGIIANIAALLVNERRHVFDDDNAYITRLAVFANTGVKQ